MKKQNAKDALRRKQLNQQTKVPYTDAEVEEMGKALAKTHLKILGLEADKKQYSDEINLKIKPLKFELDRLAGEIDRGYYWEDPIAP